MELDGLSTLWVLLAAFLVFFMQAGFGMVEAGLIRTKNAGNVLMKNLLDFCFAALGYFVFGYAIMYGTAGLLVGTQGWFLAGASSPVDGLPLEAFWLFQAVFAGTAATKVATNCLACTSSNCSALSALCPRSSLRSFPAGRLVADTACTSSAT